MNYCFVNKRGKALGFFSSGDSVPDTRCRDIVQIWDVLSTSILGCGDIFKGCATHCTKSLIIFNPQFRVSLLCLLTFLELGVDSRDNFDIRNNRSLPTINHCKRLSLKPIENSNLVRLIFWCLVPLVVLIN